MYINLLYQALSLVPHNFVQMQNLTRLSIVNAFQ
jgi:hypothetical protein